MDPRLRGEYGRVNGENGLGGQACGGMLEISRRVGDRSFSGDAAAAAVGDHGLAGCEYAFAAAHDGGFIRQT